MTAKTDKPRFDQEPHGENERLLNRIDALLAESGKGETES